MVLFRPFVITKIMKKTLVLSLGSNLGNRYAYLLQAISAINKAFKTKCKVASYFETPPWGETNQSKFINTAAVLETHKSARESLQILQHIEDTIGRTKTRKWGPRCIDIDIIFYHSEIIEDKNLHIPHPRMHERAFVLRPCSELIPYFQHPYLKKTVNSLLADISDNTTLFVV